MTSITKYFKMMLRKGESFDKSSIYSKGKAPKNETEMAMLTAWESDTNDSLCEFTSSYNKLYQYK